MLSMQALPVVKLDNHIQGFDFSWHALSISKFDQDRLAKQD